MTTTKQSTDLAPAAPRPALDDEQRVRRECLMSARDVLAVTKSGVFTGSGGEVPAVRSIVDLVELATYIDTGDLPAPVRARNDAARLVSEVSAQENRETRESADEVQRLLDGLRLIAAAGAGD